METCYGLVLIYARIIAITISVRVPAVTRRDLQQGWVSLIETEGGNDHLTLIWDSSHSVLHPFLPIVCNSAPAAYGLRVLGYRDWRSQDVEVLWSVIGGWKIDWMGDSMYVDTGSPYPRGGENFWWCGCFGATILLTVTSPPCFCT